jgi:hypothetical protein
MLVSAARRLALLFAFSAGGTAAVSALVGLVLGAELWRAVSIGLYLVGSFLLVAGFFVGNRGPARTKADADREPAMSGMFGIGIGARGVRWATHQEQEETIANSALFVTTGLVLILLGFVADSRVRLF